MASELVQLSMTYPTAASAAIPGRRVVVFDGSNRGNVKLPGSTVEKTALGVTRETQQASARAVEVCLRGLLVAESDGSAVVNPGDYVIAVANTGQVKAQGLGNTSNTSLQVLGKCANKEQVPNTAGELVVIDWNPFIIYATT